MEKEVCEKKHNGGFSLVEVLVAVVILAIVSLPVIKAFSSLALVNRNARRQENANTAALVVTEDFKSLTIEQLKARYKDDYTYDEATGQYVFEVANSVSEGESYYAGINGEKFSVRVTLDPGNYTDKTDENGNPLNNPVNNINSYNMPRFTNMSTKDNFVVRDVLYKWDNDAKGSFRMLVSDYQERYVKKSIELVSSVFPKDAIAASAAEAVFVQKITGTVTYSYPGAEDYVKEFALTENQFTVKLGADNMYTVDRGQGGIKDIYLFYTPFDINSTVFVTNEDSTKCLASDSIKIRCDYEEKSGIVYKNIDVYLVQQSIMFNGRNILIDRGNLSLEVNGNETDMKEYGTVDLSGVGGIKGPVSLYSNIYGFEQYKSPFSLKGNGITSGSEPSGETYLYTIVVDVWLNRESRDNGEDTMAAVVSTKENYVH